jgi:hypothetical protein
MIGNANLTCLYLNVSDNTQVNANNRTHVYLKYVIFRDQASFGKKLWHYNYRTRYSSKSTIQLFSSSEELIGKKGNRTRFRYLEDMEDKMSS